MHNNIAVAFLSAEVAPFAKVGGLADVAGALPKALKESGVDVRVFMPLYGSINVKQYKIKKLPPKVVAQVGGSDETISVWAGELPGSAVPVYFIKHKFFSGQHVYGAGDLKIGGHIGRGRGDVERFSFFTQAALAACQALDFQPDIVHAQDWHTALAAQMINTRNYGDDFFINTKTVYTIHNLANQGITSPEIIAYARVNPHFPIVKADAKNGDINFMVQGILGSDIINTVSPRYAKEILKHYQGAGLDNILRKRQKDLYGVLNGIDVNEFNPATDRLITKNYDIETLAKKTVNKLALQKSLGLPQSEKKCLVGFVSRLVWQKGVELITEKFAELDCQFVFLGTGSKYYEDHLKKLAKKFPKQFCAKIMFDVTLAQQVYAGADIFLVPSRFEPCGLTQMIAMRYGTVPVVRATGGLANTVDRRVGFSFKKFDSDALYRILAKALHIYYSKPKQWKKLQVNGMKRDFSWKKSAGQYLKLYKKLV
ncbi:MAG: glycogen/starch synthase [bacterium]|nr:glycogen/starch synthase [bacterium]